MNSSRLKRALQALSAVVAVALVVVAITRSDGAFLGAAIVVGIFALALFAGSDRGHEVGGGGFGGFNP